MDLLSDEEDIVKENAAQAIPELIEIAISKTYEDNRKNKHSIQAKKDVIVVRNIFGFLSAIRIFRLYTREENDYQTISSDILIGGNYTIENIGINDFDSSKRIIKYYELISICNELNNHFEEQGIKRNVSVIQDIEGNNIVVIHDIRFKGKRAVDWKDVRAYLKEFVGDFYLIVSTGNVVYIGSDLPSEYTGSVYTKKLNGTVAKAKANAAQAIPELLEISIGEHFRENNSRKHIWDARNGWYRYDSRFALPVYDERGCIERYNVFHASMLIRHSNDGKMYLYDIIDIKKETGTPLEP